MKETTPTPGATRAAAAVREYFHKPLLEGRDPTKDPVLDIITGETGVADLLDCLAELVEADKRGELHRDPLDTDTYFIKARALLAAHKQHRPKI